MRPNPLENKRIMQEMDQVTADLREKGVKFDSSEEEIVGLGDMVEDTLNRFGITQDRFKEWFGLRSCRCDERKNWLNNLFSYTRDKK